MIPVTLSIKGFLSYLEPVEIDFLGFDLACISGPNGAGKSSLLDAITWALFGQARKRDDSLINTRATTAEVSFIFEYESNTYRVQRIKSRQKPVMLEFQIMAGVKEANDIPGETHWKALTERTLRETDARIQQTLRLDYETFINASFFLQGKADQFTQQRPGDRKRILGSILGLEIWEIYRQRASERRRMVENELATIEGRLQEIINELAEEAERKKQLVSLEADLKRLGDERASQESILQSARQIATTLSEQGKFVESLKRQLEKNESQLVIIRARLDSRGAEQGAFNQIIVRAGEIESAFAAWQSLRVDLENWEAVAANFREHEKQRESPRSEIQTAKARLEQERQSLGERLETIDKSQTDIERLEERIEQVRAQLASLQEMLEKGEQLAAQLQIANERQADARAENPRLRTEMEELKDRIERLESTEGAECPICGQPLNAQERQNLIGELNAQGKELGDRYRSNQALLTEFETQVATLNNQIAELEKVNADFLTHSQELARLESQLSGLQTQVKDWETTGAPRLTEIDVILENETYAQQARLVLAQVDAQLKEIGYDAGQHDAVRKAEEAARSSENDLRSLDKARAALAPLEREIADLQEQVSSLERQVDEQAEEVQSAAASLAAAQAQAPDVLQAEGALVAVREQENQLLREVGAARQKVTVLDDLKMRRKDLETQREEHAQQVSSYRQLERAFGKDGVPALLIEQALPEIESKANETLSRLSAGDMVVRFITQTEYKDKTRQDMRETLDIQISDSAGTRDYEMYSGGEAFRVNFAIRLALSEVLAQRAGARLQTLVIDEGFGSQDALGRQRLIEAINTVRPDFAKILVITHIDELKDAFPTRIEVEKTQSGSAVRVIL